MRSLDLRRRAARIPAARSAYRAARRSARLLTTAWQRTLCQLWLSQNAERAGPAGPAQPVFVLFTPRSGSHLLAELMSSLPGVSIKPEPLHGQSLAGEKWGWATGLLSRGTVTFWRREDHRRYLSARMDSSGEIGGCTIGHAQLEHAGLEVDDLIRWFDQARFIILYRRSLGEQYTSWQTALQTMQWQWRPHDSRYRPLERPLRLDRQMIEHRYAITRRFYTELVKHPGLGRRARLLTYEELRDDPQHAFDEIVFPFLGLPRAIVKNEGLRKQAVRSLPEAIENYEEVEDLLTGPAATQHYSLPAAGRAQATDRRRAIPG